MEDREALRVASKLQEVGGALRIQGRELPGHGAAWVHRDSAQKVFMRWLLVCGTYTITPAGLDWLREGMPQPLEAPQKARHIEAREERLELIRRTEELQSRLVAGTEGRLGDLEEYQRALEKLYKPAAGHTLTEDAGGQETPSDRPEERSWWRRMFGG